VVGLSSSVLFDKENSRNPINRRISIIVMTKEADESALKTDAMPESPAAMAPAASSPAISSADAPEHAAASASPADASSVPPPSPVSAPPSPGAAGAEVRAAAQ
jgi:chemotaxis protein MotB